jgi:hypothetical protein
MFWKNIIANAATDNTKYKDAGLHKSLKPAIVIIYKS